MEFTNYIDKALAASNEMLTVIEFIKVIDYPIDMFMIERFWNNMEEDKLIYVDDELIKWMGYSGELKKIRKMHFMKILPSENTSMFLHYNNQEYAEFISSCSYIQRD